MSRYTVRGLQNDALTKGKPLSEGLRVYDAPPLRAVFSAIDSDRKVEVARIRLLLRRSIKHNRQQVSTRRRLTETQLLWVTG